MHIDPRNDVPYIEKEREHKKSAKNPNYKLRRGIAGIAALGVGMGIGQAYTMLEQRENETPRIGTNGTTTVEIEGDVDTISDAVIVEIMRSGHEPSDVEIGELVDKAVELNGGSTSVIEGQSVLVVPDVIDSPSIANGAQTGVYAVSGLEQMRNIPGSQNGALPVATKNIP